jgi:hypothetical protein
METIPVKFFVQVGSFRVPANKDLPRPRIESLRVLSSVSSTGLAHPKSPEVGENSCRGMTFGSRSYNPRTNGWGVKK